MTELSRYPAANTNVTYEPMPVVQQQGHMQTQAVQRLSEWANAAIAAHEVAESLCKTSFVPAQFRDKPGETTAAILAGSEVGLSPLASLRSFDIIGGTAAARAITLRAIVQSQGHEVWVKESTATRAIVCGKRRGSDITETSMWNMDRAKGLGLSNKDNWKKQPQAMLVARATSEVCRLVAADAILGIGYTVEELADDAGLATPAQAGEPQPSTRKMSRRKPAPIEGTCRVAGCPHDATGVSMYCLTHMPIEGEVEPVTDAQIAKLHASLGELDITEREAKLDYCSKVIDRKLGSSKDLTKAEAMRCIDQVERDLATYQVEST